VLPRWLVYSRNASNFVFGRGSFIFDPSQSHWREREDVNAPLKGARFSRSFLTPFACCLTREVFSRLLTVLTPAHAHGAACSCEDMTTVRELPPSAVERLAQGIRRSFAKVLIGRGSPRLDGDRCTCA
jgi:hypothetical protein